MNFKLEIHGHLNSYGYIIWRKEPPEYKRSSL